MIKTILFFLWWLGIFPFLCYALTFGLIMTFVANFTNVSQTQIDKSKAIKIIPVIVALVVEILIILLLNEYGNFDFLNN